MAKILIFEPEARYRHMLRFILEGINHEVLDAGSREHVPLLAALEKPDLIILGVRLGDGPAVPAWSDWRPAPAEAPALLLFSGDLDLRPEFLDGWAGNRAVNMLNHPIDPYPLLVMVKAMLTAPAEWRRGGQPTA